MPEIGRRMGISYTTARTYLQRVQKKLPRGPIVGGAASIMLPLPLPYSHAELMPTVSGADGGVRALRVVGQFAAALDFQN